MRIASGEVVSLAEGLVEGLLYRGEGGVAAGVALKELFSLRGFDIPRANLNLVGKNTNRLLGDRFVTKNYSIFQTV